MLITKYMTTVMMLEMPLVTVHDDESNLILVDQDYAYDDDYVDGGFPGSDDG